MDEMMVAQLVQMLAADLALTKVEQWAAQMVASKGVSLVEWMVDYLVEKKVVWMVKKSAGRWVYCWVVWRGFQLVASLESSMVVMRVEKKVVMWGVMSVVGMGETLVDRLDDCLAELRDVTKADYLVEKKVEQWATQMVASKGVSLVEWTVEYLVQKKVDCLDKKWAGHLVYC